MRRILFGFFLTLFLISGIMLIKNELQKKETRDNNAQIQEQMDASIDEIEEDVSKSETTTEIENNSEELPGYIIPSRLKDEMDVNNYVIGYLDIEGTKASNFIVQNKDDNEYFLHRDINGNKNVSGSIYMDSNHDINEKGLHSIYGHHMKDGSMFKDISKYVSSEYMEAHKNITIYTDEKEIDLTAVYCYAGPADGSYRSIIESKEDLANFIYEKTGKDITSDNVFVFITCSYGSVDERTYLIAEER